MSPAANDPCGCNDQPEFEKELAFELARLLEAAGCSAADSPRIRVSPTDGSIEVLSDDPAQEATLERLLANRPEFLEKLRQFAGMYKKLHSIRPTASRTAWSCRSIPPASWR